MTTNTLTKGVTYKSYTNSSAPSMPTTSAVNGYFVAQSIIGCSPNSGGQSSSAATKRKPV
jgi:hypothetical protein